MRFQKQVLYLGSSVRQIVQGDLAGRSMFTVQLFDQDSQAAETINVMDGNRALEEVFYSAHFGDLFDGDFELRHDAKGLRLRLLSLSPAGSK